MLSEQDQFDLLRAYKDAVSKTDNLSTRLRDEFQQAEAENRAPIPIQPLTGIRGSLLLHCLDSVGDRSELGEIVSIQRKSASLHPSVELFLLSSQLRRIIEEAGLAGGGGDAQIHR